MNIIIEMVKNLDKNKPEQNDVHYCEAFVKISSSIIKDVIANDQRERGKFERFSRLLCLSTSPRCFAPRDDVEKEALRAMARKMVRYAIFLLSLFLAFPSYAYLEEADDGSTKLSAGEQNTNMYRITSQGKVALKKLKQIDELMAKSPTAGDGSAKNVAQVAQIVDEQNDAAVRIAAEQARQTAKLLENKSALKNNDNGQMVQMIISAAQTQTKDAEVAATLLQTLLRRRP